MTNIGLAAFLKESLAIEGIYRSPNTEEMDASIEFLSLPVVDVDAVCRVQGVYAPGVPLRDRPGMNVRVGGYVAPAGSPDIRKNLERILALVAVGMDPWNVHVEFEMLHPFMDGNGMTGRIVWAWNMTKVGRNPFSLPFLHHWYYQTLSNCRQNSVALEDEDKAIRDRLNAMAKFSMDPIMLDALGLIDRLVHH